jgi:hypothetical protein
LILCILSINYLLTCIKKELINGGVMTVHTDVPATTQTPVNSPPDSREAEVEALARRFSRNPHPELTFEFTRDPGLLHQYYKLREKEYNIYYGLDPLSGAESENDHKGHTMIVRRGNFCVGGARINVKTPRRPHLLPMEINDFRLENFFPELGYRQLSYGQACMFVLLLEFRGGDVVKEMVKRVCYKAAALNLSFLFATCPWVNARLYRQACVSIGLTETRIHTEIELPLYRYLEGIKQHLLRIPVGQLLPKDSPIVTMQDKEHLLPEVAFCSSIVTMASSSQLERI